ncbi:MAG TPA: biosynthetic peptidoglycan transglycosylase [Lentimicrobium sp.]|nr:biosynthetic peptidoglycan transglycosylase [Lentimicrobium sp.]
MEYRRKKKRRPLRTILIALGVVLLLAAVLIFAFRNIILNKIINSKLQSIEKRYDLDISYNNANFSGISTVILEGLNVVPVQRDTLLTVDSISVSIRPFDLILNKLRFTELNMRSTLLSLHRTGNQSNYLFLLDKAKDTTANDTSNYIGRDYGSRVEVLMNALFNHIPSSTIITDFRVKANLDSNYFAFHMPLLEIRDKHFSTDVQVSEDNVNSLWNLSGRLDGSSKNLKFIIRSSDGKKVKIPYIEKRWKTVFAFDSAGVEFTFTREKGDVSRLKGNAVLAGPILNHPRISPDNVELTKSEINYTLNIGKSYMEVDSSTYISFNETGFHPYIMYVMQPHKILTFKINEPSFNAQHFFNSLPSGLFSNLEGIKVRGDLSFHLNFQIAFNQPDSLIFDAKLRGKGFSVERFGNTNFTYINQPFVYTAYERGEPVRSFIVGEGNPNYRTLTEIPEHLKQAIMTSEDGQFYYHNGFIPDAIRASIITNIKEKRFARGGSTISMQLVKNVFLNRNKNITRKLEEMLITWLIESRQMVSKDRMLEVYLNIIETGPMTYGVNEAAQFYFKKDVSKLTLAESIYIASIVPRPKLFKYSFDKEGNLREYLASYYRLVSGKMLNRGWITQEEYDDLRPEINIKGPARSYIVTDTVPAADEIIKERKGFFEIFNFDFLKKKKK